MEQYDGGIVSQLGLGASFVSIFGSLYIYFVSEDQSLGIFVGLWAPTLILISREIDKMLGDVYKRQAERHASQLQQVSLS